MLVDWGDWGDEEADLPYRLELPADQARDFGFIDGRELERILHAGPGADELVTHAATWDRATAGPGGGRSGCRNCFRYALHHLEEILQAVRDAAPGRPPGGVD